MQAKFYGKTDKDNLESEVVRCGNITFKVNIDCDSASKDFQKLYRNYPCESNKEFVDFSVSISHSDQLHRRIFAKQANFSLDNFRPFKPLPLSQAYPMLEWGMNWCIAKHCHQYLIIHAAVVSNGDVTVLLPAPPGSGKSTLTALLTYTGWQLLSDELALIRLSDGLVEGMARPINLKNNSIDIIADMFSHIHHSRIVHDTHKGSVSLFEAPESSIKLASQPKQISHVIFPKYSAGKLSTSSLSKEKVFYSLIENAFNFSILGKEGFYTAMRVLKKTDDLTLTYSSTQEVLSFFDTLCSKDN